MKFGIELEAFNATQQTVVEQLRAVGLDARVSTYAGRDYSVWQVKTDGSIRGDMGFELVSPILEGEAGIADARKACDALKALGAKVNTSCGFHIHHDVATWGVKKFRNLFKRFVKFEAAMDSIMHPSRRNNDNRYIGSLYRNVSNTSLDAQNVLFRNIDACNSVNKLAAEFGSNRYLKLNMMSFFRCGTIEFRHHHGTVNADVVERYIRLTAGLVADAGDNTAIKPMTRETTAKDALATMLGGMVKRGRLSKEWATKVANRAEAVNA